MSGPLVHPLTVRFAQGMQFLPRHGDLRGLFEEGGDGQPGLPKIVRPISPGDEDRCRGDEDGEGDCVRLHGDEDGDWGRDPCGITERA